MSNAGFKVISFPGQQENHLFRIGEISLFLHTHKHVKQKCKNAGNLLADIISDQLVLNAFCRCRFVGYRFRCSGCIAIWYGSCIEEYT